MTPFVCTLKNDLFFGRSEKAFRIRHFMPKFLGYPFWVLQVKIKSRPANQTKERAKTKSSRISPFFVNSGVFLRKTSTIHIELLFRNAPAKSSWTDFSLVWFAGSTPEKKGRTWEHGPGTLCKLLPSHSLSERLECSEKMFGKSVSCRSSLRCSFSVVEAKRNVHGNTRHAPPKPPFLKLLLRTPEFWIN